MVGISMMAVKAAACFLVLTLAAGEPTTLQLPHLLLQTSIIMSSITCVYIVSRIFGRYYINYNHLPLHIK